MHVPATARRHGRLSRGGAERKIGFHVAWKSTPERESLITVTFKPDREGTLLTLLQEQFFDAEARDRHQQGWAGAIDKLEKMFA